MLVPVGFAVGMAPDSFVITLTRRAYRSMKVGGIRAEPAFADPPTGLPRLMIADLSRDNSDRLNELGIGSAQVLARSNPFPLWPRSPQ